MQLVLCSHRSIAEDQFFQISGWSPSHDAQLSATIAAKILVFGYSTSKRCGHEQTCAGILNVLSLTTAETPVGPLINKHHVPVPDKSIISQVPSAS